MTKTILLCMSNTGGGHRSAAKAVSDAVKEIAKRRRVEVNVVTVVMTDPNGDFWTGWACKDAELTIAPNEFVRQRLLMLGLRPDRVSSRYARKSRVFAPTNGRSHPSSR